MANLTDKELRILASTLIGEAVGEGTPGMIAVMNVIKNRANDPRFPKNPAVVATQGNASGNHAFSTWNAPDRGAMVAYGRGSAQYREAERIVKGVWSGDIADNTSGAINYYANKGPNAVGEPSWFQASALAGKVQIGNHVFGARAAPVPQSRPLVADMASQVHAISVAHDGTPVEAGGGLVSRHVTTWPIDTQTGNPILRNSSGSPSDRDPRSNAPPPKVTFVPSTAKNNIAPEAYPTPLDLLPSAQIAAAKKQGADLGALIGSMAGSPTKLPAPPVIRNFSGSPDERQQAAVAPIKSGGTTYYPPGPNYGYNSRTGNYEVKQPGQAYAVDPMTAHQTAALKAIDNSTTKTITTYKTIENPEYKKRLVGGDVKEGHGTITNIQGGDAVPQFITVPQTVTVRVPGVAPAIRPVTPAPVQVLTNGSIYRPAYNPNNPSNFTPASEAAVAAGKGSYTLSNGTLMPTTAMNGMKRNTYGDETNKFSGMNGF